MYTDRYSVRNNEHSKERVSMKTVQLSAVNGHQNTKTFHINKMSLQTDSYASTSQLSVYKPFHFLLPNQQCQSTEGNKM